MPFARRDFKKLLFVAVAPLAWVMTNAPAHAQSASAGPGADAGTAIQEIVVTAQRRSENLQDVPVSMAVLSGDQLAAQRLTTSSDIASVVPNLQATSPVGSGTPIFTMRGISMNDTSPNQQGPVATYFDDVYKGSWPLFPVGFYDLERVEALRGPQGTLYGKNTTGGAINFISKKPGYKTEGFLSAGYGNYSRYEASGAVQTGLTDKIAARVAFTYTKADGWFKNLYPGQPNPNGTRQFGLRASFLYEPTDTLNFLLRVSTSLQNPTTSGNLAVPGPIGGGGPVYAVFGPLGLSPQPYFRNGLGNREMESEFAGERHHRVNSVGLTGTWKLSHDFTLTSVTSYDEGFLNYPYDDGMPVKTLEFTNVSTNAYQFAQDLRISRDSDSPLNYIVGAYYNREKLIGESNFYFYGDVDVNGDGSINAADCAVTFFIACDIKNNLTQIKQTAALYTDMTYKLTSRVVLRAGLRYTRDKGNLDDYQANMYGVDGSLVAPTVPLSDLSFSKSNMSGRAGVDFKIDSNKLLYASFSRGYRGSAFNYQAYFSTKELNAAAPETVDSIELGFKTEWLDRALTLNGALFYYNFKDQQALDLNPQTGASNLLNIPKSEIKGVELELVAVPVTGLRINGALGIIDPKITKGSNAGIDLKGNQLPNASKMTANLGVDWNLVKGQRGALNLAVSGRYESKRYWDLFDNERLAQGGFATVDAQLRLRNSDERFGITVWGRNLADKYYKTSAADTLAGFGYDVYTLGAPRTYGISLDLTF